MPLSPPGQVALDAAILGTWHCVPDPPKDPESADLRVYRFDERQYYAEWQDGPDVDRYRAYASRAGGRVLLNLQELGRDGVNGKWVFVRYGIDSPGRLRLSIVDADALKDVPKREALRTIERRASDDALYASWAVCSRPVK